MAFILSRLLGATVGEFLDKPLSHGGLALSRPLASLVIVSFIVACILLLPQKAGTLPRKVQTANCATKAVQRSRTQRHRKYGNKILDTAKKYRIKWIREFSSLALLRSTPTGFVGLRRPQKFLNICLDQAKPDISV